MTKLEAPARWRAEGNTADEVVDQLPKQYRDIIKSLLPTRTVR